jgi:hypothetical protein
MHQTPRQYSLVRFLYDSLAEKYHSQYPFTRKGVYVFFGEIPNMPGHCIVADRQTGQIFAGYHTENFAEIPEDET